MKHANFSLKVGNCRNNRTSAPTASHIITQTHNNKSKSRINFAELVWEIYPSPRAKKAQKNSQTSSVNLSGKKLTLDKTS